MDKCEFNPYWLERVCEYIRCEKQVQFVHRNYEMNHHTNEMHKMKPRRTHFAMAKVNLLIYAT